MKTPRLIRVMAMAAWCWIPGGVHHKYGNQRGAGAPRGAVVYHRDITALLYIKLATPDPDPE